MLPVRHEVRRLAIGADIAALPDVVPHPCADAVRVVDEPLLHLGLLSRALEVEVIVSARAAAHIVGEVSGENHLARVADRRTPVAP